MRYVTCSRCGHPAGTGTSRVLRKLLFHFCAGCWLNASGECESFMQKVAG